MGRPMSPMSARRGANRRLAAADAGKVRLVASALKLLNVLVVPYRAGSAPLAERYEMLLTQSRGVLMVDLTRDHMRLSAQIRAATGIATPDALQLAVSLAAGCTVFVTNNRCLPTCRGSRSFSWAHTPPESDVPLIRAHRIKAIALYPMACAGANGTHWGDNRAACLQGPLQGYPALVHRYQRLQVFQRQPARRRSCGADWMSRSRGMAAPRLCLVSDRPRPFASRLQSPLRRLPPKHEAETCSGAAACSRRPGSGREA